MSLVSPNKKAGGGIATPVEAVKRASTTYKGTLDELFHIPSIFKDYKVPDKIDKAYHEKVANDIYNHYFKGPTDYRNGARGNYLDAKKMPEIEKLYLLSTENMSEGRKKEIARVEKTISKDPKNSYYMFYYDAKPSFTDHMSMTYGWDDGAKRINKRTHSVEGKIKEYEEKVMPNYYKNREKLKQDEARDIASYVVGLLAKKNSMEETAIRTWGNNYQTKPAYQEWAGRNIEKWGGGQVENIIGSMTESGKVEDFKVNSDYWKPGVKNNSPVFGGIGDFFEGIADFAVDLTTGVLDAPVTLVEAADDIIEGKNVGETLLDTTLKVTGTQDLVDATNDLIEGDIVGAVGNTYEYVYGQQENIDQGSFVSGATPPTDIAATKDYLDTLDKVSDPSKDNPLANLREDINEVAMGEDIPVDPAKEINMPNIEKTTMKELKILLGLGDDVGEGAVIEALIGTEARKMADDPDIARMRALQGTVAERGYDVGEREALSAKARRELAGMARQQGMAAGAAAGGLRGASVAAQSRALSEQAMQKQADVTTEMDKASIARKDQARQQLATLAKDVTKFDIEKEQERKKRKGATTIGVQSLLGQEELAKQQMQLAQE